VYLSADAEEEIHELSSDKVYVIGGIVDRNRHKGLCAARAKEMGVKTARFAMETYYPEWKTAARVLTTNHVRTTSIYICI
jgi:tRNA (guanine9-N1)-methyltransferase